MILICILSNAIRVPSDDETPCDETPCVETFCGDETPCDETDDVGKEVNWFIAAEN